MNIVFKRAVTAFNVLSLPLAFAAALKQTMELTSLANRPLWDFWLSVLAFMFLIGVPFISTLSIFHEGGSEKERYFVITFNLLFCVSSGFNLYWLLLHGETLDPLQIFSVGLAPVALANAAYLISDTSAS